MSNMNNVNRIGFKIPDNYELRDHIIWSKFQGGAVSVSGTDDVSGITPHRFTIEPRKYGRFALRLYIRGQIASYTGNPLSPDKMFDSMDAAQYFATWHSEVIFAKSA
jgi:hypothetical protein